MKIIITNAFSLNMLPPQGVGLLKFFVVPADPQEYLRVAEIGGFPISSAVGHTDTAAVFSSVLGRPVEINRVTVILDDETRLLVGQYAGPRLPEGATDLPDGASIRWYVVGIDRAP